MLQDNIYNINKLNFEDYFLIWFEGSRKEMSKFAQVGLQLVEHL